MANTQTQDRGTNGTLMQGRREDQQVIKNDPQNLQVIQGSLIAALQQATLTPGGWQVMQVIPVFENGIAKPAVDVQLDYGENRTPWCRLAVSFSPDQHGDAGSAQR